jgi:hypothetical protein
MSARSAAAGPGALVAAVLTSGLPLERRSDG